MYVVNFVARSSVMPSQGRATVNDSERMTPSELLTRTLVVNLPRMVVDGHKALHGGGLPEGSVLVRTEQTHAWGQNLPDVWIDVQSPAFPRRTDWTTKWRQSRTWWLFIWWILTGWITWSARRKRSRARLALALSMSIDRFLNSSSIHMCRPSIIVGVRPLASSGISTDQHSLVTRRWG